MLQLIAQHIDALITTAGGVFACFIGFRRTPSKTEAQKRSQMILQICGPLMILFGTFQFVEQPTPSNWQRQTTKDGVASVEFPGRTETKELTDTAGSISVPRTNMIHNVPFKKISINLSFSQLPPGEKTAHAEGAAAMRKFFTQQGFTVIHEEPVDLGSAAGTAFALERDAGRVRVWARVALVKDNVYKVLIASTGSHHDDPLIFRCLSSFQIEQPGT